MKTNLQERLDFAEEAIKYFKKYSHRDYYTSSEEPIKGELYASRVLCFNGITINRVGYKRTTMLLPDLLPPPEYVLDFQYPGTFEKEEAELTAFITEAKEFFSKCEEISFYLSQDIPEKPTYGAVRYSKGTIIVFRLDNTLSPVIYLKEAVKLL